MKIGIMTGGGDAPGLNGIIESVSRVLINNKIEIIGIKNGFEGIYKNDFIPLNYENIKHAHSFAGTILGSSNKSAINGREDEFVKQYKKLNPARMFLHSRSLEFTYQDQNIRIEAPTDSHFQKLIDQL